MFSINGDEAPLAWRNWTRDGLGLAGPLVPLVAAVVPSPAEVLRPVVRLRVPFGWVLEAVGGLPPRARGDSPHQVRVALHLGCHG